MGFCTTIVRRTAAPALLIAVLACDATAPAFFDPQGAVLDAAVLNAVFDSPLLESLAFAGAEIDRTAAGVPADMALASPGTGIVGRLFRSEGVPAGRDFSSRELPASVTGQTYVFDTGSDAYVLSELPGAPSSGVRFELYAIDQATGQPAEPLSTVGQVDVMSESSRMRIRLADESGVRLEYTVAASGSDAAAEVEVEGFSALGAGRADFRFDSRIELTGTTSGMMRLRETLDMPAHSVERDCASVLIVRAQLPPELQVELLLRGPGGEVGVVGAYELGGSGSLAVDVNGDSYAAVNVAGSAYTVAGVDGEPLPASSVELVDHVMGARECGLDRFDRLVRPVETLVTP